MAGAWSSSLGLFCKLKFTSRLRLIPSFSSEQLSIFEIYPQSEMPLLTKIAHLDLLSVRNPVHLLPDTLICRGSRADGIEFRVVNYRTNFSTCFTADVVYTEKGIGPNYDLQVFFFLSKNLRLASNHLLGRHSRRRQLLPYLLVKEYQSGLSHPCRLSYQTFPTALSMTIPSIYRRSSKFHSRMVLYATPTNFLIV